MRNAFTKRTTVPGLTQVQGVWTGGGAAANCSKAAADHSDGIASVAYNAATGKYKITFTDVGQQVVDARVEVFCPTGVIPKKVNVVRSTFSRSAKTVEFEVWTLATEAVAAALTDLATTHKVAIMFEFSNFAPDA